MPLSFLPLSPTRQLLKEFQESGSFVFHGSPNRLDVLVPREPRRYDVKQERMIADGEPAVCATPWVDIAIFRALINRANTLNPDAYFSRFGLDKDQNIALAASASAVAGARLSTGFVHVLLRHGFVYHSPSEMRCFRIETPVKICDVTLEDILSIIEIFE